jgi:DNA-directed RNA polymerase specialized sigma24 family protein
MGTPDEEFVAFTRQHRGIIVSAIWRVCGAVSPSLLPDVEQDVYLALWQRWNDGKRIDYPVSYLYKVALRTALAVIRTNTVPVMKTYTTESCQHTAGDTPLGTLSAAERACLLSELLNQLPIEQARAVRAYLAGFSHTETATLYGWSAAVARHRIYRGVHALKTLVMQASLIMAPPIALVMTV